MRKKLLVWLLTVMMVLSSLPLSSLTADTVLADDGSVTVKAYGNEEAVTAIEYTVSGWQFDIYSLPVGTTQVEVTQNSDGYPACITDYNTYYGITADNYTGAVWWDTWSGASYDSDTDTFILTLSDLEDENSIYGLDLGLDDTSDYYLAYFYDSNLTQYNVIFAVEKAETLTVKAYGSEEAVIASEYTVSGWEFDIYTLSAGTTQVEVMQGSDGYPACITDYNTSYGITADNYTGAWWDTWSGASYDSDTDTFILTLSDLEDENSIYGLDLGLDDTADYYLAYFYDSNLTQYNVIFAVEKAAALSIATQPQDATVDEGSSASFSVTAAGGTETYSYQWEKSTDSGVNWSDIDSATDATYTIDSTTTDMSGTQYRCVVTDGDSSSITSDAATLTVNTAIPFSVTLTDETIVPVTSWGVSVYGYTDFYAITISSGDAFIQVIEDDGFPYLVCNHSTEAISSGGESVVTSVDLTVWTNASYADGIYTLPISEIATDANMLNNETLAAYLSESATEFYFCELYDENFNGCCLVIQVEPGALSVTASPQDATVDEGSSATFNVTAAGGTETYSYQWQESTDNGTNWSDITGATASSYTIDSTTTDMSGTQYRCVVTDSNLSSVTSDAATLTVNVGSNVPELVDGVYQISNAGQLVWFRDLVNGTLTDGTPQNLAANAILTTDIDLNNQTWTPIGGTSLETAFSGDFNGNGFKLLNLNITTDQDKYGLFAYNTGIIRNLTIESGTLNSTGRYFGAFVSYNYGIILSCLNKVDVTAERYVGGIAGRNYADGLIVNCVNTGNVTSTYSSSGYAGGIVGYSTTGSAVRNCYNTGDVTAIGARVGGITGYARSLTVINCYNAGNVTGLEYVGGLVGYSTADYLGDATLGNNYFLQTSTVNVGLSAIGDSTISVSADQIVAVSAEELQTLASALGSAFTADIGINGGYPILIWQATGVYEGSGDKTALETAIAKVTGDNAANYYQSDDRYNGSETSENGFWSDMQTVLSEAQDAYAQDFILQTQLDDATTALESAIAKLIPITQANTTVLYEAVQQEIAANRSSSTYTTGTWEGYPEALANAQALLSSMFNSDGTASAENTPEKQAELDAAVSALTAAVDGLVEQSQLDYLLCYYYDYYVPYAKALTESFDPENMNESDYTSESWAAFIEARTAVMTDLQRSRPDGSSPDDVSAIWSLYGHTLALWDAVYEGLTSNAETITVSFKYVNNYYAARTYGSISQLGTGAYYNHALTLTGGYTLNDAVAASGITFAETIADSMTGIGSKTIVYINGVMVSIGDGPCYINPWSECLDWDATQLHDGDEIIIVQAAEPYFTYYGSTSGLTPLYTYSSSLSLLHITADSESGTIGEPLTLHVTENDAYIVNESEESAAEGMTIFVSDPSATETYSAPTNETEIVTDADGNAEITFAEPGWYTIAVFNLDSDTPATMNWDGDMTEGDYNSLTTGDFILVYIENLEGDALEEAIKNYRISASAEAEEFYEQYHDYDFEDGYYEEIFQAYYTLLVANLNSATTLSEIINNYTTDFNNLKESAETAYDHEAIIAELRENIALLPEDVTGLDSSYANLVNEIINTYDGLNDYQETLLNSKEVALIEDLRIIQENGLSELKTVTVTLVEDGITYSPRTSITTSYPLYTKAYVLTVDGTKYTSYSAPWNNYAGVTFETKAGATIDVLRLIEWTDSTYWLAYSVDEGVTWTLFDKVAEYSPDIQLKALYDIPKDYTGDTLTFTIKTVTKTEYEEMVAQSDDDEAESETLEEAKARATATINQMYAVYESAKDDYESDSVFAQITAIKNQALSDIAAAESVDAVDAILDTALSNMAAVPKVESVRVVVENTTYTTEDGSDWDGTLVDTYINLSDLSEATMMEAILTALDNAGYEYNGNSSTHALTYISSINGLAEFDGGGGGGWMGTLNDWFVNEGFASISIEAGDVIHVMYTCDLGEDIDSYADDNSTLLQELSVTGGTLSPNFDASSTEYTLVLDEDTYTVTLEYLAENLNFQAHAYLNTYDASEDGYASGSTIAVQTGDVIYIGVGDSSWGSMNSGQSKTTYTITIASDAGYVNTLISNLPSAGKLTYDDKSDVDTAYALYHALTDEQQAEIIDVDKLNECVARMDELEAVENVKTLIQALPNADDLVYADKSDVDTAKAAFDALGEDLQDELQIYLVNKLDACVEKIEELEAAFESISYDAYLETGGWLSTNVTDPTVGSTGGEWAILGLARSGYDVSEGYYDIYLSNLNTITSDASGELSNSKYTEYSRVILAVTALGGDVTDIAGYNFLEKLADFDSVTYQGLNGPIWALIALDTNDYEIPIVEGVTTQTTRALLIDYILDAQLDDGGWNLSSSASASDPDMTAMALQALAPYYLSETKFDALGSSYTYAQLQAIVDEALDTLSDMQADNGTFGSTLAGGQSSESTAQVIVALTSLEINPTTDERFIKNGNDAIEALMLFYVDGGGFKHLLTGSLDGMATEQGYYALTSYYCIRRCNGRQLLP